MAAFFTFLFGIANFFLRPFVLLKLYGYFVLTTFIGAPVISFWGMFGLSLFLVFLIKGINLDEVEHYKKKDKEFKDCALQGVSMTFGYLFIWGIGYLASLGM